MALPRDSGGLGLQQARAAHAKKRLPPTHPFVEAQRPAPRLTPAPPPPRSGYDRARRGSMFGSLVFALGRSLEHKQKGRQSLTSKTIRRNLLSARGFPYTNPLQVAYANAEGDIARNILPRAAQLLGHRPAPTIRPGSSRGVGRAAPKRVAGYAIRGKDDIWLTPDAYMRAPNYARGVALHEFAHTRQETDPLPKWVVEGGADWMAGQLAKALGLPGYAAGYPDLLTEYAKRLHRPRARFGDRG